MFEIAAQNIETRFDTEWKTLYGDPPSVPIRYENTPQPDNTDEYVAFYIREMAPEGDGSSGQVSLNSAPLHRFHGQIIMHIFVRENTGSRRAFELADAAAGIWRNTNGRGLMVDAGNGGRIHFVSPSVEDAGIEGGWLVKSVRSLYHRDVIFS